MEANRDEAMNCFKIAKTAMLRNDYAKAIKFLKKANSMYPTPEYQKLLDECLVKIKEKPEGTSNNRNATSNHTTNHVHESDNNNTATSEQDALCRRVINAKTYYDVLNVTTSSSADDIKRAYKKLALKLHPDKNPSPLSSEAFKKVSTAFQCLADPRSREQYDTYGEEGPVETRVYQEYATPEQLFEAFFGINIIHQQQRAQPHTNFNNNIRRRGLAQYLPFVFFLFMIMLSNIMNSATNTSVFQFTKSARYNKMLSTNLHGVVYYVDSKTFDARYPPRSYQRVQLEYEVDYKYFDNKCTAHRREKQKQIYSYIASLRSPPPELYESPKSCITLGKLRQDYTRILEEL